jgi:PAS domain S-box-containing protein
VLFASQQTWKLLGLADSDELVGGSVFDYVIEDDRKRLAENMSNLVEVGVRRSTEYTSIRQDGTTVPVEASSVVIRDATGQPKAVMAVIRDITERKRAEEALRASIERYELAVRGAGVGIWDWDIRTGKLYFSPRWKAIFGYGENDIGDSLEDWARLLHPDEKDWMLKFLDDFLAGTSPTVTVEYRLRHKDGSYRWIVAHALAVRDELGRGCRLVGSHGDITDRKQAEEALRQSHDELRAIYDGMFEGLLILDFETKRLLHVNASVCRMLGYAEEELLSMSVLDIHPKEEAPRLMQRFHARVHEGYRDDVDVPVLRKDGSIFYANVMGNPLVYRGRQCIVAFFRDITERRQAQEALRKERRILKHLLQSSDHERQLIAYEIHDGLAQYLAGAIMQFQTFDHLKDKKPKLATKAYDGGMTMLQQGHHDARRLIAGVRPTILDEEGIVSGIAHLVHEQSRRRKPKIDYHSRIDFDRLAPILENAIYRIAQEGLANACQHSKSEKVRVSLVQQEDRVRIEIRDWGVGFDTKTVRGDHFGLEGIRQRARLLGGKCSIRSMAGKGTRIAVELPVVLRD